MFKQDNTGSIEQDINYLDDDNDADNTEGNEPNPGIPEEEQEDLLRIIREYEQIAVPLDGAHLLNREDAIYYYQGFLDQVNDPYDRIPRENGRSTATSMLLAETIETMLPSIMDVVTNSKTTTIKRRNGQSQTDADIENKAVYNIIFEENNGWQDVYDGIWDAATGRYGATIVLSDLDNNGKPIVCIEPVHPSDVSYVATAVSPEVSPFWTVITRIDPDLFRARYNLDPDEYAGAPLNDSTLNYERASTVGNIINDTNIALKSHYIKLPKGYLNVITSYMSDQILEFTHHESLNLIWWQLYRRPHSLIGWSVYDRVKGTQKAETALQRIMLDQFQFAQLNRPVIGRNSLLPETISQLQIDAPGVPVIVQGSAAGAIVPLYQSGALPVDLFQGFEYFSANAESRSGVGRNMQGVNAEALHESMTVGMVMEDRQQMRVRTLARMIANSSMVALYTAVHSMARQIGMTVEVDGNDIDCSKFQPLRRVSAYVDPKGGTQNEQVRGKAIQNVAQELVAQQKGASDGPFITGQQILNAAKSILEASGVTDPSQFINLQYQAPEPAPPSPPPEVMVAQVKAQADAANTHAKIISDAQSKAAELQAQSATETQKMQQEYALKLEAMHKDAQLKQEQMLAEMQLKREQMLAEMQLKKYQIELSESLSAGKEDGGQASVSQSQLGGETL